MYVLNLDNNKILRKPNAKQHQALHQSYAIHCKHMFYHFTAIVIIDIICILHNPTPPVHNILSDNQ